MEKYFDKSFFLNPFYNYGRWIAIKSFFQLKYWGNHLRIGYGTYIRRTHFGRHNRVGRDVLLADCSIGDFTYLSDNISMTNAKVGKFCSIGPNVRVAPGRHPTSVFVSTHPAFHLAFPKSGKSFVNEDKFKGNLPVTIGNDVWIGANCVILDGITIGDGAILAANTVANKDIEPYSIVGGAPPRLIRKRFDDGEIAQLQKVKWWDQNEQWLGRHADLFGDIKNFINHLKNE